jgi:murein L,D-transpeptidase YcbB/YkuD
VPQQRQSRFFRSLLEALAILVLVLVPDRSAPDRIEPVRERLEQRLGEASRPTAEGMSVSAQRLRPFYRNRGYRPAWVGEEGLLPEADDLVAALRKADSQGLVPADYHLPQILSRLPDATADGLAELDLLLTDAFLLYCIDVRSGRADPRDADPEWFVFADRIDHLAALENAIASHKIDRVLGVLHPRAPEYQRLQQALQRYRKIAARGEWPQLPKGKALKKGARGPAVAKLRERLRLSGDLQDEASRDVFDTALEAAVRRFQVRHGLQADGIVGRKTRTTLNVPVAKRIQQIILNMERWRWMPRELGRRYILVNMAGFELHAVEHGESVLHMRVIVGRAYRRTPAFSESLTYLVFNPYWNVPPSVAVLDILPKLREQADYLQEQKIRVFSNWSAGAAEVDPQEIDWSQADARRFPYKLRQDPGPKNALGRVKFMLPNRFNVYLHDTPNRKLFNRIVRTFSAGCIRLERPLDLAHYALMADPRWTPARIRATVRKGKRQVVALPEPIPVYLVYWTAWVDDAGTVHFRRDVYSRDRLLQEALARGRHAEGSE